MPSVEECYIKARMPMYKASCAAAQPRDSLAEGEEEAVHLTNVCGAM
jgi:hypothetical protein